MPPSSHRCWSLPPSAPGWRAHLLRGGTLSDCWVPLCVCCALSGCCLPLCFSDGPSPGALLSDAMPSVGAPLSDGGPSAGARVCDAMPSVGALLSSVRGCCLPLRLILRPLCVAGCWFHVSGCLLFCFLHVVPCSAALPGCSSSLCRWAPAQCCLLSGIPLSRRSGFILRFFQTSRHIHFIVMQHRGWRVGRRSPPAGR